MGTVRVFRQKFTLEDAIGPHASSLEASRRVTNGIPLGCPRFLPVYTVNCVQTLKASSRPEPTSTCDYLGKAETICSEPCGGGTQAITASNCECNDPDTICDIALGPFEIVPCNSVACDSKVANTVSVQIDIVPEFFWAVPFEEAVGRMVGYPIRVRCAFFDRS
jgi:hypothetical protein